MSNGPNNQRGHPRSQRSQDYTPYPMNGRISDGLQEPNGQAQEGWGYRIDQSGLNFFQTPAQGYTASSSIPLGQSHSTHTSPTDDSSDGYMTGDHLIHQPHLPPSRNVQGAWAALMKAVEPSIPQQNAYLPTPPNGQHHQRSGSSSTRRTASMQSSVMQQNQAEGPTAHPRRQPTLTMSKIQSRFDAESAEARERGDPEPSSILVNYNDDPVVLNTQAGTNSIERAEQQRIPQPFAWPNIAYGLPASADTKGDARENNMEVLGPASNDLHSQHHSSVNHEHQIPSRTDRTLDSYSQNQEKPNDILPGYGISSRYSILNQYQSRPQTSPSPEPHSSRPTRSPSPSQPARSPQHVRSTPITPDQGLAVPEEEGRRQITAKLNAKPDTNSQVGSPARLDENRLSHDSPEASSSIGTIHNGITGNGTCSNNGEASRARDGETGSDSVMDLMNKKLFSAGCVQDDNPGTSTSRGDFHNDDTPEKTINDNDEDTRAHEGEFDNTSVTNTPSKDIFSMDSALDDSPAPNISEVTPEKARSGYSSAQNTPGGMYQDQTRLDMLAQVATRHMSAYGSPQGSQRSFERSNQQQAHFNNKSSMPQLGGVTTHRSASLNHGPNNMRMEPDTRTSYSSPGQFPNGYKPNTGFEMVAPPPGALQSTTSPAAHAPINELTPLDAEKLVASVSEISDLFYVYANGERDDDMPIEAQACISLMDPTLQFRALYAVCWMCKIPGISHKRNLGNTQKIRRECVRNAATVMLHRWHIQRGWEWYIEITKRPVKLLDDRNELVKRRNALATFFQLEIR